MIIVYCNNPLDTKKVDFDYEEEYRISKQNGFDVAIIDFEELNTYNNPNRTIKVIKEYDKEQIGLYRGWMMKPEKYEELYNLLLKRNVKLINSPMEYTFCHYLPESYSVIKTNTPKSVWIKKEDIDNDYSNVFDLIKDFDGKSLIIKDYVKSYKHNWEKACFIKDSNDKFQVKETIDNFLSYRDKNLNEGIVFREFVQLEIVAEHKKSKMPIAKEYRIFFINNELFFRIKYWEDVKYEDTINIDKFTEIAKKVKSNFFTMDIAKLKNGDWIIIELGDGQVSGLPEDCNFNEFYEKLKLYSF